MLTNDYKVKSVGKTIYGQNVLVSIVSLATKEIEGVCALQGRGVRLQIDQKTLAVDIFINVFNFVSCNDLAFKIQENVKRSVESMTEYKVDVINVNVLGVSFFDKVAQKSKKDKDSKPIDKSVSSMDVQK